MDNNFDSKADAENRKTGQSGFLFGVFVGGLAALFLGSSPVVTACIAGVGFIGFLISAGRK